MPTSHVQLLTVCICVCVCVCVHVSARGECELCHPSCETCFDAHRDDCIACHKGLSISCSHIIFCNVNFCVHIFNYMIQHYLLSLRHVHASTRTTDMLLCFSCIHKWNVFIHTTACIRISIRKPLCMVSINMNVSIYLIN